ncbi:hypothetical protein [Variovorax sp. YR752]|uniref:hypothetical protein n=1 Tax=Variovorax sp. YR752 TaxID=1884383 RepID=UPI0031383F80
MKRSLFVDRSALRRGASGWLRQRIDLVLGLLVVAAWAVVAIDADRSMRAAQAAAATPVVDGRVGAARAQTGTAAMPDPARHAGTPARS